MFLSLESELEPQPTRQSCKVVLMGHVIPCLTTILYHTTIITTTTLLYHTTLLLPQYYTSQHYYTRILYHTSLLYHNTIPHIITIQQYYTSQHYYTTILYHTTLLYSNTIPHNITITTKRALNVSHATQHNTTNTTTTPCQYFTTKYFPLNLYSVMYKVLSIIG